MSSLCPEMSSDPSSVYRNPFCLRNPAHCVYKVLLDYFQHQLLKHWSTINFSLTQMRKASFMMAHEYKDLNSKVLIFIILCYIWKSKVCLYIRFLGTNLIANICYPHKPLKYPENSITKHLTLPLSESLYDRIIKQK